MSNLNFDSFKMSNLNFWRSYLRLPPQAPFSGGPPPKLPPSSSSAEKASSPLLRQITLRIPTAFSNYQGVVPCSQPPRLLPKSNPRLIGGVIILSEIIQAIKSSFAPPKRNLRGLPSAWRMRCRLIDVAHML